MEKNNYSSSYIAGIGIGLSLLATFYITGWGLGASSPFSIFAAVGLERLNPSYAGSLEYFSRYLNTPSPLQDWVVFEIMGLFLGALAGALLSNNFSLQFDRGKNTGRMTRLITVFAGGILIGFAARLSRGCTSGVALSGGSQLAVSGFLFVTAMFVSGFLSAAIFRRLWL